LTVIELAISCVQDWNIVNLVTFIWKLKMPYYWEIISAQ